MAESSAPIMQGMVDLTSGAKGKSTVLGEADLYPAHYAAMMNATLAHSMDYDDTHRVAIMHTGAPMFATLLALGEEYSVSGKEFLTAAVAGYDIANKIGKAHGPSMHHRGFHPTATTGIFACTGGGGPTHGPHRKADGKRDGAKREPDRGARSSSSSTALGTSGSTLG